MDDFDNLLKGLHNKEMKIVLDLVLNHTSITHPWFIESASSKDNSKRDWYIWRDGKKTGGRKPPNNWKAIPGGPAWIYYKNTDQWYYFHFLPFQPDLNYRNPEVKEEMLNTMRFWLNKGVDGFRLDILHSIYEDKLLRNNPFSWTLTLSDKKPACYFQYHKYDLNLPETLDFTIELRNLMEEYEPERFLVGEIFVSIENLRKYYEPNNNGLHMTFLFEFASTPFKSNKYRKVISRIEKTLPFPYTPTLVYTNHDRGRKIFFLKDDIRKAKILATMQLTLRGVPFIYYGEEIGMSHVKFKLKTSEDPIGVMYSKFPFPQIARLLGFSLTRDSCRTPMQWNVDSNAGFTPNPEVKTWLKISDNYKKVNVSREEKNPDSLLNCYKRLIEVRRENISLQEGLFRVIDLGKLNKKCVAYKRIHEKQEILVYLNFTNKDILFENPIQKPDLIFSTLSNRRALDPNAYEGNIKLTPFEGVIFK